jgi:hypothetical protein
MNPKQLLRLLLIWATAVNAQNTLTPADFAFTATISDGQQSLRQFAVPYQVFSGLQRQDYGDMRIFNQQNQAISFTITPTVAPENWQRFQLTAGKLANEWLFTTNNVAPVIKVGFEIPSVGLFYQGSLYSKPLNQSPTEPVAWHYQSAVTQYRLLTADGEVQSVPFEMAATKDQQWKLVLEQPAALLPSQVPVIKLAWQPMKVTFLAQGNPPYRLYFGNAAVEPLTVSLPAVSETTAAEQVRLLAISQIEKNRTLSTAIPAPFFEIYGQKLLLWGLLCFGVLLMAGMAYKLYLKINAKQP